MPGPPPSDKPAIVMLHGFALDARMWRHQVAALRDDFRVLTVDLPGFGPQARNLGELYPARAVLRAMDACRIDKAHLVGASYGAAVAIDLALLAPRRVHTLSLVAPYLLGRRIGVESWDRCVALAQEGDRLTAIEVLLDDPLFEGVRADEDLFDDVRQIALDYGGGHWTGQISSVWDEGNPEARLRDVNVPALVVSGEADLPTFIQMAEACARGLPNVRREILRGTGHHVNLEAPEAFTELLRSFLATNRLPR